MRPQDPLPVSGSISRQSFESAVQVQRWLGHHSPSFTLDTYVHLLDGDLGDPLEPVGTATCTPVSGDRVALVA